MNIRGNSYARTGDTRSIAIVAMIVAVYHKTMQLEFHEGHTNSAMTILKPGHITVKPGHKGTDSTELSKP